MGEVEKLAIISDALDQLVPNSKTTIVFELNKIAFDEFNKKLNKNGSPNDKNFNIDISGTYFYFTLNEAE
jgi:glutathionyl-hydroquinone reductase